MTATIQTLAAALAAALISGTRTNGDTFYKLADGSPEWMTEAVQAAHGDMFPDDWRYSMIRNVASAVSETDEDADLGDECGERCDGLVDVYNHKLLAWLASHSSRVCYCDDAAEEGLIEAEAGIIKRAQIGQFEEYREIWGQLVAALETEAETQNADADADAE